MGVHLSGGVLVPHARNRSGNSSCLHSAGLLRLRHHLQVRCRLGDLQNLVRQVPEGGPFAMICLIARRIGVFCFDCTAASMTAVFFRQSLAVATLLATRLMLEL